MTKKILSCLLPLLMVTHVAQADVDLIAIGQVDANYQDLAIETAAPLENGVAGNILGGIGSGLAYAGGNDFIALPDRGPNANSYNEKLDDTASYISRFHTFNLSLANNPDYKADTEGSLPFILTPHLIATTLLSSPNPLSYGVKGAPALNTAKKFYYTGRSDGFNPKLDSTDVANARLDPEAVRVANDGKSVFISDEYGPHIYQFDRSTGGFIKSFKLPDYFTIKNQRSYEKGDEGEIAVNTSGRTSNKGMESLAISPDGKTLIGMMQRSLIQDTKKYLRIITIDIASGKTHEYAYLLTDGAGVSEILAINSHEFLVNELDGTGLRDGSPAKIKRLFKIDLAGAMDISGVPSIGATTQVVKKTLFLDLVEKLVANGVDAAEIPAKIEGAAFGADIKIAGKTKHTLFISSDNDFLATVENIVNPNKIFVFSVDETDLPGFEPQKLAPVAAQ